MRLRFTGPNPVQLPTPFGYVVKPGDVVEVPDHHVHFLRQHNISNAFAVTPDGEAVRLPSASYWENADFETTQTPGAEPEQPAPFEPIGPDSRIDPKGETVAAPAGRVAGEDTDPNQPVVGQLPPEEHVPDETPTEHDERQAELQEERQTRDDQRHEREAERRSKK